MPVEGKEDENILFLFIGIKMPFQEIGIELKVGVIKTITFARPEISRGQV